MFSGWLNPSRSLPTRIALFVFGTTLVSSLVVTGISVQSMDSFLSEEIERSFPDAAERARERLNLWYAQRELEAQELADSDALRSNLSSLSSSDAALDEVTIFLDQVERGADFVDAIALNVSSGGPFLIVGEAADAETFDSVDGQWFRTLHLAPPAWLGDRRVQILSVPVAEQSGVIGGQLHMALRLEAVDEVLRSSAMDPNWKVSLLDAQLEIVASSGPLADEPRAHPPLRPPDPGSLVSDSTHLDGPRTVGLHRPFPRLDATLLVEVPHARVFEPVQDRVRRLLGINLVILLTLALAALRLSLSVTRPIEALSSAAGRISRGGDPRSLPETDREDELGVLSRAFRAMTTSLSAKALELEAIRAEVEEANARLREKNEELMQASEVFEQLSITDGLTKLHNHRHFQDQLTKEARRAERSGAPLSLILADIDHFKMWNDELGHAAGDKILSEIAAAMSGEVRDSDLLARYGGEEFAVLAPQTGLDEAVALAERLRAAIGRTRFFVGLPPDHPPVSASFGVAQFEGAGSELFEEADKALYAAKEGGRDCVMSALDVEASEGSDATDA